MTSKAEVQQNRVRLILADQREWRRHAARPGTGSTCGARLSSAPRLFPAYSDDLDPGALFILRDADVWSGW